MENRRSILLLAITGLVLALPLPAAAAEAAVSIHPNPAHPGEIPVLVVEGSWSNSCVPRLSAMWVQPMTFVLPPGVPSLYVALLSSQLGEGCLSVGTSYRLDIPLPFRAEEFPFGLNVFVSVETGSGDDTSSHSALGEVFLDVRHLPREKLPLHEQLFEVTVEWTDTEGHQGSGKVVPGFSPNSGLFWFFRPSNWELLVKVLNGCALNGHYWVLGAGATNVGYSVRVHAPWAGNPGGFTWTFTNPVKQHSRFFVDTEAVACAFPSGGS